ncbi:MAG: phosphoglycerate mutase family protein [Wenzhouxiangellaceae bacterium]|nr:phosphoglycerate mutase family protein [Wenzhouxiangellaceae bacterium]
MRHAEKVDDSQDPPLSGAGEARARALAGVLADAGLDATYASQYRRTRQTAKPAADAAGIEVRIAPIEGEIAAWAGPFAETLIERHGGETVLVVGHSNTVPALVAKLCDCTIQPLTDADYDHLYIVERASGRPARLIRARYGN